MDKKRMDKRRAIELLKQALIEIPHLRELHHGNQELELWFNRVRDVIKAGLDEDDQERFPSSRKVTITGRPSDDDFQKWYLNDLEIYETRLKSIIQKYEIVGFEDKPATAAEPAVGKAFIAHGGKSGGRDKLESFLIALGVTPIIVEDQPSEGRSVDKNVEHYLRQCDCAIILATKGDVDGRTGGFIPRGNILIEIGRAQEILSDRMIYLLEKETKFPTDIDEKVWEHFTEECMDKALIKVAKELRAFGLIKAMKR